MESSQFDDQIIFSEFAGPLSPIGSANNKNLQSQNSSHSIQVMLSMPPPPPGTSAQHPPPPSDMRLPEVHSILPGSPKIDHYKNMDYSSKIEYSNVPPKMDAYSAHAKMDYINGKLEYSPNGSSSVKLEYSPNGPAGVKLEYSPNGKIEYTSKMDYDHMSMFQQPQPLEPTTITTMNGMGGMKRKSDDINSPDGSSTNSNGNGQSGSECGGQSSVKKNEKKKSDPNGVKKKKTR